MNETRCPQCAWPTAELPAAPEHAMSQGRVDYRRCVCGSWLALLNGDVVGATRPTLAQVQPVHAQAHSMDT
jgi:hypothetical protein